MHTCRLRHPGVQMRLLRSPVLRTRPALSRSCVLVPVHVLVLDYDYDYDYDYESEKLPTLLILAFAGNLFIPRISAKRSECCRPSAVVTKSLVIVFPRKAQKARNGDREWRFVVASISRRLVLSLLRTKALLAYGRVHRLEDSSCPDHF